MQVATNLTFSLPYTTGMQLREIARHKGMSVAEVIGEWIRNDLKAGSLESAYSPIRTQHDIENGALTLAFFGGERTIRLSLRQADTLSKTMSEMATLGGLPSSLLDLDSSPNQGPFIQMSRHGAAFVLQIGNWTKTMSPIVGKQIAHDIADAVAGARIAVAKRSGLGEDVLPSIAAEEEKPRTAKTGGRSRRMAPPVSDQKTTERMAVQPPDASAGRGKKPRSKPHRDRE